MAEGQIYKIHSDFYYVQKDNQTFECKIREVLKKQQLKIVVGDGNGKVLRGKLKTNYCRIEKIPLYRTDKQGTIVLKSDGEKIEWNMAPSE